MSAPYTLRTRPSRAGVATQQGKVQVTKKIAEVLGSQALSGVALHAAPAVCSAITKDMACTYSDVAASRPSSPASAMMEEALSSDAEAFARPAKVEEALVEKTEVVSTNNTKNIVTNSKDHESDTSSLSGLSNLDEDQNLWTTVVLRRSRSLDSLRKNKKTVKIVKEVQNRVNNLTAEQNTVVIEAEKQLTSSQKEQLSRRYEKVRKETAPRDRSESRGERPSTSKGKGIDPRNWGDAQFSESDVDIEAQRAALESFTVKRDKALEHISSDEEQPKKLKPLIRGKKVPPEPPRVRRWTARLLFQPQKSTLNERPSL